MNYAIFEEISKISDNILKYNVRKRILSSSAKVSTNGRKRSIRLQTKHLRFTRYVILNSIANSDIYTYVLKFNAYFLSYLRVLSLCNLTGNWVKA